MSKFTIHSIVIDCLNAAGGVVGPIQLGAITNASHPLNNETTADDSGGIFDEARSLVSQLPEGNYTTKSIQTILAVTGLYGFCFYSNGSHPGIRVYGRIVSDCKNNPAATANLRYTVPRGLIVPITLSADRGADATMSFMIHELTDGGNAPFSYDYSGITLPTAPIAEKYGMGAFRVGNVAWREPQGWGLDFNVTTDEKSPAVGGVWADTTGVRKCQPKLSIRGQDPTMLDNSTGIPLLGGAPIHSNTVLQLKQRLPGGAYYANNQTEHCRITLNGMSLVNDPFNASGDGVATMDAQIETTYDGTNAPVLFGFDQQYTDNAA